MIEDIQIAAQIDKYQHWKSPQKYRYPKRPDGSSFAGNTYERVALATIGLRIVVDNPVGIGVARVLPYQMDQVGIDYKSAVYTNSAWIDLALNFEWPSMLYLLLLYLLICAK